MNKIEIRISYPKVQAKNVNRNFSICLFVQAVIVGRLN